ncbi:MAG: beta strand repeat-containing protein, partial [Chthoniobacterales bacterium]
VVSSQLINSDIVLGVTGGASTGYQFNNASTGGATLTVAGNVMGGSGGTAGAKTLTLLGVGGGTLSGSITNGGATSLSVTISSGTWTLSGPSSTFGGATFTQNAITYTRSTQINGPATVLIGSNSALGTGDLNISGASAATFQALTGDRALPQSIILTGDSSFTTTGSYSISLAGKLVFNGSVAITNNIAGAGKTLTIGGNVEVRNATTNFSRTITFNGSGTTILNGPVVNNDPSISSLTVGSLAYTGSGTLKSTAANTYTGTTSVGFGGTYLVNGSHSSATVGNYTVNGTLGGTGTITPSGVNSVTVGASGALSPGDSTLATNSQTGTLAIGNTINLNGGSVVMQIGGAAPGNGQGFYDQLNMTNVAGAVNLNGVVFLSLSLVNGFAPSGSDIFYIVSRADAGSFFTFFDGTTEGGTVDLGGGVTGQITYLADWTGTQGGSSLTGGNDIAIYNVAVPEPAVIGLVAFGLIAMVLRKRRIA